MGGRRWTQEELDALESMCGTFTVATMAKRLGRSFDAVNIKLNRMGLAGFARSTDLLTLNQASLMLGVERRTFRKKWAGKGLRIMRKGYFYVIRQEDLMKYLKEHPEDWSAADITDDTLFMGASWYKAKKRVDKKTQYHWTKEEVAKLDYLKSQGYSLSEIARKMGRSESSVKSKLYYSKDGRAIWNRY